MVDQAKRTTLKAVALSGAGAAAFNMANAFAVSASDVSAVDLNGKVNSAGMSVTHYENFNGHTVLIRNNTDATLSLQKIYPAKVKTSSGILDLEKLVLDGELQVPANTTQAVSITQRGEVFRYARWSHIGSDVVNYVPSVGSQFVDVYHRYGAGLESVSRGLHFAAIA